MKKCPKCRTNKNEDAFWKSAATLKGLQSWCKECLKDYKPRRKAGRKHDQLPLRKARRKQIDRWRHLRQRNQRLEKDARLSTEQLVQAYRKKWATNPPAASDGKLVGVSYFGILGML